MILHDIQWKSDKHTDPHCQWTSSLDKVAISVFSKDDIIYVLILNKIGFLIGTDKHISVGTHEGPSPLPNLALLSY